MLRRQCLRYIGLSKILLKLKKREAAAEAMESPLGARAGCRGQGPAGSVARWGQREPPYHSRAQQELLAPDHFRSVILDSVPNAQPPSMVL